MRTLLLPACVVLACLTSPPAFAQAPDDQAVFARSRVLDIRIVMTPDDWRTVRSSRPLADESVRQSPEDGYVQKPAELWIDGTRVGRVGVRKKGTFGSVVSTRPSLKIEMDAFVRDVSYGGVSDLTLNNNVQDLTLVNQLLAYDFFARAGVPAPRANHAHVRVNDEDMGVYTHVEAIGRPFLRRVFGTDRGALYEATTGDFRADELSGIAEKRGGSRETQLKLERLRDLLGVNGPVPLAEIGALVDLDSFIRFWAAESLIGHWDGYSGNRNNTFLYVHPADGKLRFITWGADQVFIDPGNNVAPLNPPRSVKATGLLSRRLWELPEIRRRYQAQLRDLLGGVWDEARMLADVDALQRPVLPLSVVPVVHATDAAERIRSFITRRRAEVTPELTEPGPDWPVSTAPRNVPYMLTATFTAPWGNAVPPTPSGVGSAQLTLQIDGQPVTFEQLGAYAYTTVLPNARAGYPGVVITALSGTRTWRITLTVDPMAFGPGAFTVDQHRARVLVSMIEAGGAPRNRVLGNFGELRLEEARASEGGVLRGTITLRGVAP